MGVGKAAYRLGVSDMTLPLWMRAAERTGVVSATLVNLDDVTSFKMASSLIGHVVHVDDGQTWSRRYQPAWAVTTVRSGLRGRVGCQGPLIADA